MSASDIARVARAVFSTRQWFELFGSRYYRAAGIGTVAWWCERDRLPPGWRAVRHGHRFYIFYAGPGSAPADHNGLTPEQVSRLRKAAARGLAWGEQKKFAEAFGCSESYVSRVVRGLRLKALGLPAVVAKPDFRRVPRVSPELASAVFDHLLTVKEWVESIGPTYGINSLQYGYQLCSERPNGPARYPTSLPAGWHSVRAGESWLIYDHGLSRRASLLD